MRIATLTRPSTHFPLSRDLQGICDGKRKALGLWSPSIPVMGWESMSRQPSRHRFISGIGGNRANGGQYSRLQAYDTVSLDFVPSALSAGVGVTLGFWYYHIPTTNDVGYGYWADLGGMYTMRDLVGNSIYDAIVIQFPGNAESTVPQPRLYSGGSSTLFPQFAIQANKWTYIITSAKFDGASNVFANAYLLNDTGVFTKYTTGPISSSLDNTLGAYLVPRAFSGNCGPVGRVSIWNYPMADKEMDEVVYRHRGVFYEESRLFSRGFFGGASTSKNRGYLVE